MVTANHKHTTLRYNLETCDAHQPDISRPATKQGTARVQASNRPLAGRPCPHCAGGIGVTMKITANTILGLHKIALIWTSGDIKRADVLLRRYLEGANKVLSIRRFRKALLEET